YWGGALLALELDLELRRGSAGRVGLSEVLWRLRGRPTVTLGEFGRAVDEVAGAPLWRAVARAHLQGQALARAPALPGALGLWRLRGGPPAPLGAFGRAVDEVAGAPLWRAVAPEPPQGQALARAPALLGALGIGPAGLDDEAPAAAWRQRLAPPPGALTPGN